MGKSRGIGSYILISVSILLVLAAIGIVIWLQATSSMMNVKPPSYVVPNPNAYDYYCAAADLLTMPDKIGASNLSLQERKNVVKANQPALEKLREGFQYQCALISSDEPLGWIRTLARLLAMEQLLYIEDGEYDKAMASCVDGIRLADDTLNGATLLQMLTSAFISDISTRRITPDYIDKLTISGTKTQAKRLQSIIPNVAPYAQVLENDRYDRLSQISSSFASGASTRNLREKITTRFSLPGWISGYNEEISRASLSYAEYVKLPQSKHGFLWSMVADAIPKCRLRYERTMCSQEMLLLQLALHAYKLEHGKYPTTLDYLAPRYVQKLPRDRFASKGTYKYKTVFAGYVLYSVGPDLKDNSGKPILPDKYGITSITKTSMGDIVVEHRR